MKLAGIDSGMVAQEIIYVDWRLNRVVGATRLVLATVIITDWAMERTPLYDRLILAQTQMGEYCGVETSLNFGDARTEYQTLLTGAAVYDLGWRAKVALTGGDRMRWANGM